jgi:transcriptional regulator with XRE-family HTH domain
MKKKKDYRRIKALLVEKGLRQNDLAELIEMNVSTLNLKLNGHNDFTLPEIEKLVEKLGISDSNIRYYFFEQ